jgi:hypothetical protein
MDLTREKEAINAYLKLLQSKGASSGTLYKRSAFLDELSKSLADKPLNSNEYKSVIDTVMETAPAEDWHIYLNTAREFYPFWLNDIKAIAAFNLNYGFDIEEIQWQPIATSLKELTDSLEQQKFDTSENWPLKAYAQAMRFDGAEQGYVEARLKLAKIILLRLRDAPIKNHKSYRVAVDLTLPLFKIKESKQLFLIVVREFYNFWTGNPDAANMLLGTASVK